MGAGRPLEKLDLDDGWQNEVIELYSAGASDVEVKALIYEIRGSFSNDLWDRWLIDEPEFSETIKVGKMLSEAWWAKSGRVNLKDKDFSYTGWYMNMKNRFGWSDRVQNETNLKVTGIKPIEWVKTKDVED
jgi:hypothetical protein